MKEDLIAGKFLFLSGDRSPEASTRIDLFLERYKKKEFRSIRGQLPGAAQRMKIDEFPEPIRSELRNWGYEDEQTIKDKVSLKDRILPVFVAIILILVIVSIPVGLWNIVTYITSLF